MQFPDILLNHENDKIYRHLFDRIESARENGIDIDKKPSKNWSNSVNSQYIRKDILFTSRENTFTSDDCSFPLLNISCTDKSIYPVRSLSLNKRILNPYEDDVEFITPSLSNIRLSPMSCIPFPINDSDYKSVQRRIDHVRFRREMNELRNKQLYEQKQLQKQQLKDYKDNFVFIQSRTQEWNYIIINFLFIHYYNKSIVNESRHTSNKNKLKISMIVKIQRCFRRFSRNRFIRKRKTALYALSDFIHLWISKRKEFARKIYSNILVNFFNLYKKQNIFKTVTQKFFYRCRTIQSLIRRRIAQNMARVELLLFLFDDMEQMFLKEYQKTKSTTYKTFKYGGLDDFTFKCKISEYNQNSKHSKVPLDTKLSLINNFFLQLSFSRNSEIRNTLRKNKSLERVVYQTTLEEMSTFYEDNGKNISLKMGTIEMPPLKRISFIRYIYKEQFHKVATSIYEPLFHKAQFRSRTTTKNK